MTDYKNQLKDISEIRNLMEESTRFVSLSGLSGVSAGIVALIGAAGTYMYLHDTGIYELAIKTLRGETYVPPGNRLFELIGIALLILICAFSAATFFTVRNARRQGKKIYTRSSFRMGLNLSIPLIAGAIFCIQLALYGATKLVAPTTLIFYGMALLNAGKYTLREIRYLGISEIILGLIAMVFPGYGIIFWAIGFGVLHIVYGTMMYLKYER